MMKIKCFIFMNEKEKTTEKIINEWFALNPDINVQDIKVTMGSNGGLSIHTNYTNYTILYNTVPLENKHKSEL